MCIAPGKTRRIRCVYVVQPRMRLNSTLQSGQKPFIKLQFRPFIAPIFNRISGWGLRNSGYLRVSPGAMHIETLRVSNIAAFATH